MSLTAPVSQDNFSFSNGDLYVETSGRNFHRRATVSELRDLFHPPRNSNVPTRDPPAHWYEAQLIHYGLPSSKVKGTAVKRLLDAVNSGGIAVPPHLIELERSLKKRWDANEKKAKKEAVKKPALDEPKGRGTKRKAEGMPPTQSAVGINQMKFEINVNVRDVGVSAVESVPPSSTTPAKKVRTEKVQRSEGREPSRQAHHPVTTQIKQTARGGPKSQRPRPSLEVKKRSPSVSPTPRKIKTERYTHTDTRTLSTPRKIKPEPSAHNDRPAPSSSPSTSALGLINGFYVVSCPYVTEQWGCEDLNIVIRFDTQHVWCAYDLEMFTGIFLLDYRPVRASDERIPVRWRGREHGEGEMRTGDNNRGWISFLGGGRIEGSLRIVGDFKFEGYKSEGGPTRTAQSMKDEWESYNEDAYGYESVERWR